MSRNSSSSGGCLNGIVILIVCGLFINYWKPILAVSLVVIAVFIYRSIKKRNLQSEIEALEVENRAKLYELDKEYHRGFDDQLFDSTLTTYDQQESYTHYDEKISSLENELEQKQEEIDKLLKEQEEKTFIPEHLLKTAVAEELNRIDKLNGKEFEHYCGDFLKNLGYKNINITASSGDQGIDVLASMGTTSFGFQCKNYISVVGNKAVQEVIAGRTFYKVDRVGVITNNYFTNSARQLAIEGNVELWDRDTIKELIEDDFKSKSNNTESKEAVE
nr:MAG TPA: Restriction endonuclease [Caudoviricetes sp.]